MICCSSCQYLNLFSVKNGYFFGHKGCPIVVCVAMHLKKPDWRRSVVESLCYKEMLRVVHYVFSHFKKCPYLHHQLKRPKNSPQNGASLLYQCMLFFLKALALTLLHQQITAHEIALSTSDL